MKMIAVSTKRVSKIDNLFLSFLRGSQILTFLANCRDYTIEK